MYILLLNGEIALPFMKVKKFDIGTGYIALFEEREKTCILCRYLERESTYIFNKVHFLYDCSNGALTNETVKRLGKPVIILRDNIRNFDDVDKIVETYQKTLYTINLE